MMKVRILDDEKRKLWSLAGQIDAHANKHGMREYCRTSKSTREKRYLGYLGEFGFSKLFNLKWNVNFIDPNNRSKKDQPPDIESDIEVRTVDKASNKLIIRPHDIGSYRFVLGYYHKGWVEYFGFIDGHSGKDERYYQEGRHGHPAYYIPKEDLNHLCYLWPMVKGL